MEEVQFEILPNIESKTFCILENPYSPDWGTSPIGGFKVLRSPYHSEEEARKAELEIAKHYGWKPIEVKNQF